MSDKRKVTDTDDTSGQTSKRPKYLENTDQRIQNITQDLENIKKGDIDDVKSILKKWKGKARKLLHIVNIDKLRPRVLEECNSLNTLVNNKKITDLFSVEQHASIDNWKAQFASKIEKEEGKSRRTEIDEVVSPWMRPYIYSKLTQQDGKFLTLESGVKDFYKFLNAQTGASTDEGAAAPTTNWMVPRFLNAHRIYVQSWLNVYSGN